MNHQLAHIGASFRIDRGTRGHVTRTLLFLAISSFVVATSSGCDSGNAVAAPPTKASVAPQESPAAVPKAMAATAAPVDPANVRTVRYRVDGLTCEGCAWQIRESLGPAIGVVRVLTSVSDKHVTVEYDVTRTNPDAIARSLHAIGYDGAPDPG